MQLENYEQLKLAVEAADMVLVGLGEEWVLNEDIILEDLKNRNKDNGKVIAGEYFGSKYTYDETFKMFEDFVSLLEKIMAIETESFVMTCSSQALQNFSIEANFIWTASSDGRQHKQLRYESNGVACCIQPKHYLKYAENHFSILSSDLRYEKCIRRLEGCIITR